LAAQYKKTACLWKVKSEPHQVKKNSDLRRYYGITVDLRFPARNLVCLRSCRWVYNTTSKMLV